MAAQHDGNEDRWVGRPVLAAALKALLYAVPMVASTVAVVVLARVLPVFGPRWLWFATLGGVAIAVSVAVERLVRRLLPLATLLKLTMLFPDKAPSRYKMARSAGNPEALAERLAKKNDASALGAAEQVLALITALGNHDRRTRGHSERVRVFADLLAEELRLDEPARDRLRWASLLHDLGKLSVAATVLNKPAKLDADEFALMKLHPERGAEMAAPLLPWLGEWGRGILEHHEKYDGTGYPAGLSGTDISTAGRVVGLVDAFETMTSARPYKKPMATRAARQELADCAGQHFDPLMVRAFLSVSLPRLVWAMGPLSFLVQLPFLSALAQTGTRASQLSGQAAATATTMAGAGVVATAAVVPFVAPAAYEQPAPERATAASRDSSDAPSESSVAAGEVVPAFQASPTDLFGAAGTSGLDVFGQAEQDTEPVFGDQTWVPSEQADRDPEVADPVSAPAKTATRTPAATPEPTDSAPADPGAGDPDPAAGEPPASEPGPVPDPPVGTPSPAPTATASPTPSASPSPSPSPSPSATPTRVPSPTASPPAPSSAPVPAPAPAPVPAPVVPPSVALSATPSATRTLAGASVEFHSPDPLADSFQCRLDAGGWVGCATVATAGTPGRWTVFPPNGDHEIFVRAASPLGGWGPVVSTGTFRMAVPPTVVLQNPPTGTVTTSDVTLSFSSPEPTVTSYACAVDGGAWTACTSPLSLTLADGAHRVEVRATSPQWGTGVPAVSTFTVDLPGPRVTFTQAPTGAHPSATVELQFTSDQPDSTFACRIDGAPEQACTSPLLLTGLVDGNRHVHIRASSALGGEGPNHPLTFLVQSAPHTGPTTTLDAVPPATVPMSSASVAFSSPDAGAGFRCSVDGGPTSVCASPLVLTGLADGPHSVQVHAVTSGGLLGPPVSTSFDVAVPPLVLVDVPGATTTATAVTFTWTGADAAVVTGYDCRVVLDGGASTAWTPCSSGVEQVSGLPVGRHRFELRARGEDADGIDYTVDETGHTWEVTAT